MSFEGFMRNFRLKYPNCCPFCKRKKTSFGEATTEEGQTVHYVACISKSCGVVGPQKDTWQKAARAWNKGTQK